MTYKQDIKCYPNNQLQKICFYKDNKLHNPDGPAVKTFYKNGQLKRASYFLNGEIGSNDGTRVIKYTETGIMYFKEISIIPTLIVLEKYDPINGNIYMRTYSDLLHGGSFNNSNGPACIEYHPNGQISKEIYVVNNTSSREDGPAIVTYDENGSVISKRYFINGKEIDELQFLVTQYGKFDII